MVKISSSFLSYTDLRRNPTPRSGKKGSWLEMAGRAKPFRNWAAGLIILLLLGSCSAPRGWVEISSPGVTEWKDDTSPESLKRAIAQSVNYFRRLPETTSINYGELRYSPDEIIQSLEMFLELKENTESHQEFVEEIWKRFHVFESVAEERENLFTGYYEPVIQGRENPTENYISPVYKKPDNLVEIDLSLFGETMPKRKLIGRLEKDKVFPFFSREEIQDEKALEGLAEPIAYVNEIDLFFLQIQGSGIIRFPQGREIRVGYHGTNGHPYRSIGVQLIREKVFSREEVSMQSIKEYLMENPAAVKPLLNTNPSYVFFRPMEEGPMGNIEVPLTPGRSLALDKRIFPKGGLVYIEGEAPLYGNPEGSRSLNRFMLVQDTGGAIRGHGRGDVFWGKGIYAEWNAGYMKHPGRLFLLVAKKEFLDPGVADAAPD